MKEIINIICFTIFGITLLYFIYKMSKLNYKTIPDDLPEYRNPPYDLSWTSSKKTFHPTPIVEGKTKSNRKKGNGKGRQVPPPPRTLSKN